MSLNFLATRFSCSWPWTAAVLLCDGRVVCGCADPYAQRVLGDVRIHSLREVSHIYLYTSTNGLAFSHESAKRLVRSGIDEVTFSIDGATPASYARYRQRGDLEPFPAPPRALESK